MQLEAAVDDAVRDLGAEQLGAGGLGGGELTRVEGFERAVDDGLGGVHLAWQAASSNLVFWKCATGLPKTVRYLHVLLGEPDGGLGLRVGAEGDAPALGGEGMAEVVEALVLLAEQVLDRDLRIDERQLGGVEVWPSLSSLRPTE